MVEMRKWRRSPEAQTGLLAGEGQRFSGRGESQLTGGRPRSARAHFVSALHGHYSLNSGDPHLGARTGPVFDAHYQR